MLVDPCATVGSARGSTNVRRPSSICGRRGEVSVPRKEPLRRTGIGVGSSPSAINRSACDVACAGCCAKVVGNRGIEPRRSQDLDPASGLHREVTYFRLVPKHGMCAGGLSLIRAHESTANFELSIGRKNSGVRTTERDDCGSCATTAPCSRCRARTEPQRARPRWP